jgi:uncharacterized protein (TIGR00290 family)
MNTLKKKTLLSWSSGKDSAWALHRLQFQNDVEVVGLFTTINQAFNRVAMHAVRLELLQMQAQAIGLPLHIIEIPYPCSNDQYALRMEAFVNKAKQMEIEYFAFGDLFLEDIRQYREERLASTGIQALFPLWRIPTNLLAKEMIAGGLKAKLTCIDPSKLDEGFAGCDFDDALLAKLPVSVDPCGENGEFHSFVYDGPMFKHPIAIKNGHIENRDGFVFADLLPGV